MSKRYSYLYVPYTSENNTINDMFPFRPTMDTGGVDVLWAIAF